MCDRILVMHEGRMAGELARDEFSEERLMALATGAEEARRAMTTATQAGGAVAREPVGRVSQLAAGGALIIVFIYLSIASAASSPATTCSTSGEQTSVTAIIAIGMTLVIITAGIDLSVGAVAALAGVIGVKLMVELGLPPNLAIAVGVLVGALGGLVNGLLVTVTSSRPSSRRSG